MSPSTLPRTVTSPSATKRSFVVWPRSTRTSPSMTMRTLGPAANAVLGSTQQNSSSAMKRMRFMCVARAYSWPARRWRIVGGPGALRLLGRQQVAVVGHVAVLAADRDVDEVLVADVADPAHGRGVDSRDTAGAEAVHRAVAELELGVALVDEVRLLLLVVVVAPAGELRRHDDDVDAQRLDVERGPDLAEAAALTERRDVADGIALARDDLVCFALRHRQLPSRRTAVVRNPRNSVFAAASS